MMNFGEASMTRDEVYDFLMSDEHRFVAVASVRKDGRPFVVPLGYWADRDHIYLSIAPDRGGTKRLRRNPNICLTVFNDEFPVIFATISGVAEEIADSGNEMSLKIHHRTPKGHVVDEEAYERNWLAPGRVVFRVALDDCATMDPRKVKDLVANGSTTPAERAAHRRR